MVILCVCVRSGGTTEGKAFKKLFLLVDDDQRLVLLFIGLY